MGLDNSIYSFRTPLDLSFYELVILNPPGYRPVCFPIKTTTEGEGTGYLDLRCR